MAKDKENDSRKLETVLVMQGGGSLGAYECGVYKALSKYGKKFDIVIGTSIGAINAAIITSSTADDNPSKKLEDFWLTLAQSIGSPIRTGLYYQQLFLPRGGIPTHLFLTGCCLRTLDFLYLVCHILYLTLRHSKILFLDLLISTD
jgi:predicted acylesterase/phospholipase RssA